MSPMPLRDRLPAALRLQPMTKTELARCLGCTYSRIDQLIRELHLRHVVKPIDSIRLSKGRPHWIWGIA